MIYSIYSNVNIQLFPKVLKNLNRIHYYLHDHRQQQCQYLIELDQECLQYCRNSRMIFLLSWQVQICICCKFVNLLANLGILRVNCQKQSEGLFPYVFFFERINAFILPNFAICFGRHHQKSTFSQFNKEAYIESNIRRKRKRNTEGRKMEYRDCRYN